MPQALGGWHDPNPRPMIDTLPDGTWVVRDDLLPGGTKRRALDYLIGHDPQFTHITDWSYGSSPAHGYAQWALGLVCERYHKRVHLFMANRAAHTRHRLQTLGLASPAAVYHWVPNGMLSVTQKRARDFVSEDPATRALIPMGGNAESSVAALTHVCRQLPIPSAPDHIWTVMSSGTLSRALQTAFPTATVHAVTVGHHPSVEERGRAIVYRSPYAFSASVKAKDAPPYPSASEYDAKVWPFFREWRAAHPTERVLIWNVGA